MLSPQPFDQATLTMLELELPKNDLLTAICNVNPGSQNNQSGALRIRIKNFLAALDAPDSLKNTIMEDLSSAQKQTKTRAYYLWDDHGHIKSKVIDSHLELPEMAHFGAPDLEPWYFGIETSPLTAIALVDREWRRLLTVRFGEIEEQKDHHLESDKSSVLGRDTDNHQRERHDDQVAWRPFIEQILDLHQTSAFERLLIAGPPEVRSSLLEQLPKVLSVVGEFVAEGDATPAHILEAAQAALQKANHAASETALANVLERGVRGSETTLTALQEGRVYKLLVSGDGSGTPVWRDDQGYIFATYPAQGISPLTGSGVEGTNLRQVLGQLRQRFGLKVLFLYDDLAVRLETESGGLGGLLH